MENPSLFLNATSKVRHKQQIAMANSSRLVRRISSIKDDYYLLVLPLLSVFVHRFHPVPSFSQAIVLSFPS